LYFREGVVPDRSQDQRQNKGSFGFAQGRPFGFASRAERAREPSYARGIMCWTAKPVIRHLAIKRSELNELCRNFRVRRLSAFGSALTERFDEEKSDLDFVVEFESLPKGEHAKTYFGLIEALQGLFGRRVDLLEQDAIRNPYVKQEIDRTQQNLYGA
jgi:uncharacterized protein